MGPTLWIVWSACRIIPSWLTFWSFLLSHTCWLFVVPSQSNIFCSWSHLSHTYSLLVVPFWWCIHVFQSWSCMFSHEIGDFFGHEFLSIQSCSSCGVLPSGSHIFGVPCASWIVGLHSESYVLKVLSTIWCRDFGFSFTEVHSSPSLCISASWQILNSLFQLHWNGDLCIIWKLSMSRLRAMRLGNKWSGTNPFCIRTQICLTRSVAFSKHSSGASWQRVLLFVFEFHSYAEVLSAARVAVAKCCTLHASPLIYKSRFTRISIKLFISCPSGLSK